MSKFHSHRQVGTDFLLPQYICNSSRFEYSIFEKLVVSGPAVFNFKDIYDILSKSGAGKVVKTPQEFYEYLEELLNNKAFYEDTKNACKNVFDSQRGAIQFVIDKLKRGK